VWERVDEVEVHLLVGSQRQLDQKRGSKDWCSQGLVRQARVGEGVILG